MIGRGQFPNAIPQRLNQVNVDYTKVDYYFYDRLRRGKQVGYQLGGLFVQPIAEIITAWVLGSGLEIEVKSDTPRAEDDKHPVEMAVNDMLKKERATLFQWIYDSLTLGDSYLVVNPDASLTPVMPSQVKLTTDAIEWRKVIETEIMTTTDKATITDRYSPTERTITINRSVPVSPYGLPPSPVNPSAETTTYTNLIGLNPVIHLPNDREANELTGHPIIEALLKLMAEYDDVVQKSLNGVKVMGNPMPTIEGSEDADGDLARLSTSDETFRDADGTEQTRPIVDFTQLSMVVVGKGGSFKFASPGQFTQDAGRMLEYLFLLMLQHTKIPEWVWGGAVASSKASVDAQTPAFYSMIEGRRAKLENTLLELITTWVAMQALTDPSLTLADDETVCLEWPELTSEDEKFNFEKANAAHDKGLITDVTFVKLADLVENAEMEVEQAKQQGQAGQDQFNQRLQTELDKLNTNANQDNQDLAQVA